MRPTDPGCFWSLTAMLRRALRLGGREGVDLAAYAFRSHGLKSIRRVSNRPTNPHQVAALRFFLRRCPLAVDPQLVDVAKVVGA